MENKTSLIILRTCINHCEVFHVRLVLVETPAMRIASWIMERPVLMLSSIATIWCSRKRPCPQRFCCGKFLGGGNGASRIGKDAILDNTSQFTLQICRYIYIYVYIKSGWFQTFCILHPYLGKISNLTNIFQMGWNHQLNIHVYLYLDLQGMFFELFLINVFITCFMIFPSFWDTLPNDDTHMDPCILFYRPKNKEVGWIGYPQLLW